MAEEIDATAEDYERVIAWCHEHGYLDDSRFVARFIASRSRKGYGPARICQELNQKGISAKRQKKRCVNVTSTGAHWRAIRRRENMANLCQLSFRKVKIQRFLLYRGYLMEDIQDIWRNFAD